MATFEQETNYLGSIILLSNAFFYIQSLILIIQFWSIYGCGCIFCNYTHTHTPHPTPSRYRQRSCKLFVNIKILFFVLIICFLLLTSLLLITFILHTTAQYSLSVHVYNYHLIYLQEKITLDTISTVLDSMYI
jgi:hypothetical protein